MGENHRGFDEPNRKQRQRREKRKEKCREWDLNPRTPKGRDIL